MKEIHKVKLAFRPALRVRHCGYAAKQTGKLTMRFQKGNKFSKGGTRGNKGGRPTKQQQEIKKAAKEIAQEYIEAHIKPLMETYMGLPAGKVVERRTPEGKKKFELSVDPSTTRDAVGKLVPDAKVEPGEASRPVQINFLQFGSNPPQLPLYRAKSEAKRQRKLERRRAKREQGVRDER